MSTSNLVSVFIDESRENLQILSMNLLEFEENPEKTDVLNEIFRTTHTIKGMAKTVELDAITSLTHNMENHLETIRNREKTVEKEDIKLLFQCVDKLEAIINNIADTGSEQGCKDVSELIEDLQKATPIQKSIESEEVVIEEIITGNGKEKPIFQRISPGTFSQTIRVSINKLDNLISLSDELNKNKSRLIKLAKENNNNEIISVADSVKEISDKLKKTVMELRMVPVAQAFNRFPRLIRDISRELGKDVVFITEGKEIQVDRAIIDELAELLVHLIRNSLDHGIETCEERILVGKKAKGMLKLTAAIENTNIVIKVIDDGKGIDVSKAAQKAVEKGLITRDKLTELKEAEILNFLYEPGFTLSEKTTVLSGRGVGMDVVKSKISALNGNICIQTEKGAGTTIVISLPIDLSVINSLLS